nr:type I-E CRISPR-associated protein Cas5/CasD [Deinobacterium chartae]
MLLRIVAPMQSWGSRSRFDDRDTEREPTKSGVIGLIAAALGRPRDADVSDLAALRFGVRVDRAGSLHTDYHTAREGASTAVTRRHYLADAAFLVGLEGDAALLERIEAALRNPVWPPFLGRKSFVPARPLFLEDGGLREAPLEAALRAQAPVHSRPDNMTRYALELLPGERPAAGHAVSVRNDQPAGTFAQRRYAARQVAVWSEPRPQPPATAQEER